MKKEKIKTLLLYAHYTNLFSYFDDWKDAFVSSEEFEVTVYNLCALENVGLIDKVIGEYDLIVLLHSTNADTVSHLVPYKDVLCKRKVKLLVFVGNEVNIPGISMVDKIQMIKGIGADFIGTQLLLEAGEWLYAECAGSKVIALPHALNPNSFMPVLAQEQRPIDIGVRTSKYYPTLGDNERNNLLDFFSHHRFSPSIALDISTDSRFNRKMWGEFLDSCKATIANEAGSYYLERDDKTVNAIREYALSIEGKSIIAAEGLAFRLWLMLPEVVRQSLQKPVRKLLNFTNMGVEADMYGGMEFQEVYDRFFSSLSPPPFHTKAISSRHFDAVGTKTCQILIKGRYNNILREAEHYIGLERDFSNINAVMEQFHDVGYRQELVDRTYEYVMDNHTHQHRLQTIRSLIEGT